MNVRSISWRTLTGTLALATPLALALVLASNGCSVTKPATFNVPAHTRPDCARICDKLGMRLSAVVVILNSAGCVCESRDATGASTSRNTAAVAGGAVIQAVRARQEQARQQRVQSRR